MSFFDDKKRDFLPVRDGADQGGGQERAMINAVGGVNGIRRREEDNFDGTTTTLYTRKGRPVFETTEPVSTGVVNVKRGFLVKDPQSGYAVLFNPYDLSVLKRKYVPALNTYAVQHFGTRWNVPSTDTTHWNDVVLFDGTSVKVNARYMTALMTTADHGFAAVPFVIDTNDNESRYGSQELNLTQKRVFAVGRDQVKSWGGGGVTETLTPITPRAEGRALTIGQHIDRVARKAFFGQLFHTAMSWDDIGGEWGFSIAEVSMLLTPPYLVKVSSGDTAAMTPPELVSIGPSSGSMTTAVTLPATAIGMYATPSVGHYADYPTTPHGIVYFTWAGVVAKEMAGTVLANYSRITLTGTENYNFLGVGTYTATNTKTIDSRSEYPVVDAQYIDFTDTVPTSTDMRLNAASDHLFWSLVDNGLAIDLGPMRGQRGNYCQGEDVGSRPYASRDYETQNGSFVMSFSGVETIRVTMFREYSTGQQWNAIPNMDYYNPYMGLGGVADYGDENGYGIYNWPYVENYHDGGSNPVSEYKRVGGVQSPEVCAEINSALNSMVNALMGQTVYQSENAEGYYSRPAPWSQGHYLSSITEDQDKLIATLTWETKDFLLFDQTNGVYISVEGHFSGSGTSASLTVNLKVQTRYHTNTISLFSSGYTYTELLPEKLIDPFGSDTPLNRRVPSPQIRAIFAPLYQGQESFHGAHYITASEEANGATPYHGVNFRLVLRSYDGFDTCNEDNSAGRDIHFVPCNLIEMLYCFVFSQEYGVNEYFKYPVTYADRFTALSEQLFKAYRISVRDGVVGNWTDTIDPKIASISNATLHRI